MNRPTERPNISTVALCIGAALFVIVLIFGWQRLAVFAEDAYESVAYSIAPSPERAFAYGERHFSAANGAQYDLDRAYHFFMLAAATDPTYPYLFHEIARISFLRGNFTLALTQIDFQIDMHSNSEPNSYYVRALIEGFMGDYGMSAKDYEHFIQYDPNDWAAINDYAWVLLKAGRAQDATDATLYGLGIFPDNPWLLNSNAIALYEIGDMKDARSQAVKALDASETLTQAEWLHAYPGNDPKIAAAGIAAFQKATTENMHTILSSTSSSAVQLTQP